jgi:hypothetical protein
MKHTNRRTHRLARWLAYQHPQIVETQEASRSALMLSFVLWGALVVWSIAAAVLLLPIARAFFF